MPRSQRPIGGSGLPCGLLADDDDDDVPVPARGTQTSAALPSAVAGVGGFHTGGSGFRVERVLVEGSCTGGLAGACAAGAAAGGSSTATA